MRMVNYNTMISLPLTYNNPAQSPVNNLISLDEFLDAADYNPIFG